MSHRLSRLSLCPSCCPSHRPSCCLPSGVDPLRGLLRVACLMLRVRRSHRWRVASMLSAVDRCRFLLIAVGITGKCVRSAVESELAAEYRILCKYVRA
jgi:hypothetical protein